MSKHPFLKRKADEEEEDVNPEAGQTGAEFYAFVVGGGPEPDKGLKWSDQCLYIPRVQKKGDDGRRIPNKYWKGDNTRGEKYELTMLWPGDCPEGNERNLDNTNVYSWNSGKDELGEIFGAHKTVCNFIKKWLNSKNCAVWWHDSNSDVCSQFGGKHLHVVIESVELSPGVFRRENAGGTIQTLKKHIKSVGGYFRSRAVRYPYNFVKHFNQAPRVFLGSRSGTVRSLRYATFTDRTDEGACKSYSELCGGDEDVDDKLQETAVIPTIDSEDDDVDGDACREKVDRLVKQRYGCISVGKLFRATYGSTTVKRSDSGSDKGTDNTDGGKPVMSMGAAMRKAPSKAPVKADQVIDKQVPYLKNIMVKYWAHEKQLLVKSVDKMDEEEGRFIMTMNRTNKLDKMVKTAMEELGVNADKLKFKELADMAMKNPRFENEEMYMPLPASFYWWFNWVMCSWGNVHKFTEDLIHIIDKKQTKVNALVLKGAKGTGKTFFIQEPLKQMQPFRSVLGNVGTESQFQWESSVGARIIFLDECKLSPSMIETAKSVFGGEEPEVNRKHQTSACLYRAPVVACGNDYPWVHAFTEMDREAMRARCIVYDTVNIPGCPNFGGLLLNPRIFWYLIDAFEQTTTSEEFTLEWIYKFHPELEYYAPEEPPASPEEPTIEVPTDEEEAVDEKGDLN